MRNVKNTNHTDYSVETAEGGFHAVRAGKTELVDLNESKVEEYRSKGFEISELVEEDAQKQPQGGQGGAAGTEAQASGDSQPVAKKPEAPATQTGTATAPAKEADKKADK